MDIIGGLSYEARLLDSCSSPYALKNSHEITNNMAEATEIEQLEPTGRKQGGKLGTKQDMDSTVRTATSRLPPEPKLGIMIVAHHPRPK